MELLPAIDTLQWVADAGPGILADEKVSCRLRQAEAGAASPTSRSASSA